MFTAAKDQIPTLWYAKTGERIGTYQGHQGAVWDLAVSCKLWFFIYSVGKPLQVFPAANVLDKVRNLLSWR